MLLGEAACPGEQGFLIHRQGEKLGLQGCTVLPQVFGLPRFIKLSPFCAGVCAEIGESFAPGVPAGKVFAVCLCLTPP